MDGIPKESQYASNQPLKQAGEDKLFDSLDDECSLSLDDDDSVDTQETVRESLTKRTQSPLKEKSARLVDEPKIDQSKKEQEQITSIELRSPLPQLQV